MNQLKITYPEQLPVSREINKIKQLVNSNQIVIVCGETGSGKTTQLPTYILDDNILLGKGEETFIICSQPRRIAAITVAERVSEERCELNVGNTIGYQIKLKNVTNNNTKILYCTTGVLLRYINFYNILFYDIL